MWAGIPVNKDALRPIFLVAKARDISSSSNLWAVNGNYRYSREGRTFGVYWIGGGGVYYRRVSLSRSVVVGNATVCTPTWQFFGYTCVDGNVTQDETLVRAGSTAFGGNGGMGFTIRINDGFAPAPGASASGCFIANIAGKTTGPPANSASVFIDLITGQLGTRRFLGAVQEGHCPHGQEQ